MIPRYCPTYSLGDLCRAWKVCAGHDALTLLRQRLAEMYQRKHVFLFGNARSALYAVLKAHERPGGVVLPAYTCLIVPEIVHAAGYRPVFADIGAHSVNVTAETLSQAISRERSTTVVLMTHQLGIPCDVEAMRQVYERRDVLVIEDAAAAVGAKYRARLAGTFGHAAVLSFHWTKALSGVSGGALLTDDDELAAKIVNFQVVRSGHAHIMGQLGQALIRKVAVESFIYPFALMGYRVLGREKLFQIVPPHDISPTSLQTRCSEFAAALILVQLGRLERNVCKRDALARLYAAGLSSSKQVDAAEIPADAVPAWLHYPLWIRDKRSFYKHMQSAGVDLNWTFRYSCADSFGLQDFPNSRWAAQSILGLPTFPSLSVEDAMRVCAVARDFPQNGRLS